MSLAVEINPDFNAFGEILAEMRKPAIEIAETYSLSGLPDGYKDDFLLNTCKMAAWAEEQLRNDSELPADILKMLKTVVDSLRVILEREENLPGGKNIYYQKMREAWVKLSAAAYALDLYADPGYKKIFEG